MGQILKRKMDFFGHRFPAWLLVVALAMAGAGAATGIVLADSITGRTTVAVSQAVLVAAPPIVGGSHGLTLTVAIEDAQSTGFYETQGTLIPVNV